MKKLDCAEGAPRLCPRKIIRPGSLEKRGAKATCPTVWALPAAWRSAVEPRSGSVVGLPLPGWARGAATQESPLWGSNPRPYAYGAHALPTELKRRLFAQARVL